MVKELLMEAVTRELKKIAGDGVDVELNKVTKNNAVTRDGIFFRKKGDDIGPIIYLEDVFNGDIETASASRIAADMYALYQKTGDIFHGVQAEWLLNWKWARKIVQVRVINYSRNRDLLKSVPHKRYFDLAVVCYLELKDETGTGSSLVKNEMLSIWKISEEELMTQAVENMVSVPCICRPLKEYMRDLLEKEMLEEGCELIEIRNMEIEMGLGSCEADEEEICIMKLRNLYGAAAILDTKNFAALKKDLWILPSSVYELVILPFDGTNGKELKKMVRCINFTDVQEEDILSDNIYFYSYEKNLLAVI